MLNRALRMRSVTSIPPITNGAFSPEQITAGITGLRALVTQANQLKARRQGAKLRTRLYLRRLLRSKRARGLLADAQLEYSRIHGELSEETNLGEVTLWRRAGILWVAREGLFFAEGLEPASKLDETQLEALDFDDEKLNPTRLLSILSRPFVGETAPAWQRIKMPETFMELARSIIMLDAAKKSRIELVKIGLNYLLSPEAHEILSQCGRHEIATHDYGSLWIDNSKLSWIPASNGEIIPIINAEQLSRVLTGLRLGNEPLTIEGIQHELREALIAKASVFPDRP